MVTATPKPTEVHDASALEKALSPPANPASTSPGLSNFSTARNSTTSPLDETKSSHRYLNEEQALDWCRKYPGSEEEIYITYSQDDKDNPRNWGLYRKWYITCLVSMANVLTCLCAGGWSSGATYFAEEFGVSAEVATLGTLAMILVAAREAYTDLDVLARPCYVCPRFCFWTTSASAIERVLWTFTGLLCGMGIVGDLSDTSSTCSQYRNRHCLQVYRRIFRRCSYAQESSFSWMIWY